MSMDEAIRNFAEQFSFRPTIENEAALKRQPKTLVLGMGGSHLAADLLLTWKPGLPLSVRSEYGLPEGDMSDTLVVASSHSGNTEEVLEGYAQAKNQGLPLAAIAVGGALLEQAKKDGSPYVQMPDTGIQPRSALGLSIMSLFQILGEKDGIAEATHLTERLNPAELEAEGKALAERFRGMVPIIYATTRNRAIAYNWKIKLNETGKIPAFMNVIPELNHNEMNGFDMGGDTSRLIKPFRWVFLQDNEDRPENRKRMDVLEQQLKDRGLEVERHELSGTTPLEKIFRSLLIADWFAYHTAVGYGAEPEQVPMIEEFKTLIAE